MKIHIVRLWAAGIAASSLIFCVGCEEDRAGAQVPTVTPTVIAKGSTNVPTAPPNPAPAADPAPATAQLILKARPPESLQVSPALADIIKLTQAGVTDDVILAYITNAPRVFQVGSDEILYLNDLGLSSAVITTLIQNDHAPEALALMKPGPEIAALPPGLSLTVPATNIYPTATTTTTTATVGPQNVAQPLPPAYVAQPPVYEAAPPVEYVTQPIDVSPPNVAYFYDSLSPYGNWVNVEGYGTCWQPTVAVVNSYWRPYGDRGRWLWSDHGWYWYSDYSWGWAPFHYGRWHSSPSLGWFWIPDTTWGPAWVTWRQTSTHCGWAPLPPGAVYHSGLGFTFHGSSVGVGFGFGLGLEAYSFVPFSRFCDRNVYQHNVAHAHAGALYKDSVVVNNYIVGHNNTLINQGVGINPVMKATGSEIHKIAIRETPSDVGKSARHERFEGAGSAAVVYHPQLPKDPPRPTVPVGTRSQPRLAQPKTAASQMNSPVPLTPATSTQPASSVVEVKRTATSLTIARRPVPAVYPSSAVTPPTDKGAESRKPLNRPRPNGASGLIDNTPSPKATTTGPMQPLGAPAPLAAPKPLAAPQPVRPATPPLPSVRADLPRASAAPDLTPQRAPSFGRPAPVVRESAAVPVPRPSYEAAPRSYAPSSRPEPVRPQPAVSAPARGAPAPAAPAAPVTRYQAPAPSNSGGGKSGGKSGLNTDKNP